MADLLTGTTIGGHVAYHAGNFDPASVKGMSENEKTNFNNLLMRQAEYDYLNSRAALGYKGGAYDIFADSAKIASQSQVTVSTLAGGDPVGKVELVESITFELLWDVTTATFDGAAFSVAAQETAPNDFAFKPDGTKMYIVGSSGDDVSPYTLTTTPVNNGFLTSGNFVTTTIDLTADLSAPPTKVVVSTDLTLPTNTAISVTISDGTNNVVIPAANFDAEVDCSALTSRTLTATWTLETTDTAVTPTLDNYALYFTE